MQNELGSLKFTLTKEMASLLLEFDSRKKKLMMLKKLDKNDDIELQIIKLNKELLSLRKKFISEFRINNTEEINKYLQIKSDKESI